jgi:uncharacterized membrane protein SpoIIM required for sporulation
MKEAAFVKQNKARWEEFERTVKQPRQAEPDKLADLFIQVTDDLSFSRTKYPDSRTTQYLNALAGKVHLQIYKNKREEKSRFVTFWKYEVPEIMFESRKQLLYSFIIFTVACVIGALSTYHDKTFVRLILGDEYVNMTLENIKNGNPTRVYSNSEETIMFFYITVNNIMVAFRAFALGVLTSVCTGLLLFYNGVMVGSFMSFFAQQQQATQAIPVVMLHGTIELSSIVIAGAAGLVMGNGLLFPGTYSRMESFKRGAVRGMKIVVGLVPFFIMAGFIESFITRYAFMHWSIKLFIITVSAILIIHYFIVYPHRLHKHANVQAN